MTKQQTYRAKHRAKINSTQREWRSRNKDKTTAHRIISDSVKSGVMKKPVTCERCGSKSDHIHAHHYDYSKPLSVIWMCRSCHSKLHGIPAFKDKNFARGEKHGRAKLTRGQVMMIRALNQEGYSKRKMAKDYGVSEKLIRLICEGEIWKTVI